MIKNLVLAVTPIILLLSFYGVAFGAFTFNWSSTISIDNPTTHNLTSFPVSIPIDSDALNTANFINIEATNAVIADGNQVLEPHSRRADSENWLMYVEVLRPLTSRNSTLYLTTDQLFTTSTIVGAVSVDSISELNPTNSLIVSVDVNVTQNLGNPSYRLTSVTTTDTSITEIVKVIHLRDSNRFVIFYREDGLVRYLFRDIDGSYVGFGTVPDVTTEELDFLYVNLAGSEEIWFIVAKSTKIQYSTGVVKGLTIEWSSLASASSNPPCSTAQPRIAIDSTGLIFMSYARVATSTCYTVVERSTVAFDFASTVEDVLNISASVTSTVDYIVQLASQTSGKMVAIGSTGTYDYTPTSWVKYTPDPAGHGEPSTQPTGIVGTIDFWGTSTGPCSAAAADTDCDDVIAALNNEIWYRGFGDEWFTNSLVFAGKTFSDTFLSFDYGYSDSIILTLFDGSDTLTMSRDRTSLLWTYPQILSSDASSAKIAGSVGVLLKSGNIHEIATSGPLGDTVIVEKESIFGLYLRGNTLIATIMTSTEMSLSIPVGEHNIIFSVEQNGSALLILDATVSTSLAAASYPFYAATSTLWWNRNGTFQGTARSLWIVDDATFFGFSPIDGTNSVFGAIPTTTVSHIWWMESPLGVVASLSGVTFSTPSEVVDELDPSLPISIPLLSPGFFSSTVTTTFPGSDFLQLVADVVDLPVNIIWILVFIMISMLVGYFVALRTENHVLTAVAVGAVLATFSATGILPFWVVFAFAVAASSVIVLVWGRI